MTDAPVVAVLGLPDFQPALDDPERRIVERDLEMVPRRRHLAGPPAFRLDELLQVAVQPLAMDRIDRVLHDLQPVARDDAGADHANRGLDDVAVEQRELRRRQRAEIHEQHPGRHANRITRQRHLVFEGGAFGFVRLVDAAAGGVEHPAVIRAADTLVRGDAVGERCAAVRARLADQAEPPVPVLEEDQIFAQQTHALRPAGIHLARGADGVPVPPEQIAHPRPRAHLRQRGILFFGQHDTSLSVRATSRPSRQR